MSKQEHVTFLAGVGGTPGDAPPQYPQSVQGQNTTPYGQPPGNPYPQQQYSYGQYASGTPQSQPFGVPPQQQQFQQPGAYPPPPNSNFTPSGPAMVGSSGGGPPSNAGYFGGAVPGASMYGAPNPYQQNYGPGVPPGQMNQNAYYGNGNAQIPNRGSGQAKSFCGTCMTSCIAIVAAFACIDCLF